MEVKEVILEAVENNVCIKESELIVKVFEILHDEEIEFPTSKEFIAVLNSLVKKKKIKRIVYLVNNKKKYIYFSKKVKFRPYFK